MAKHNQNVQQVIEFGGYFTRDTSLCNQDIQNIARKLARKTYKKHENDVDWNIIFVCFNDCVS